MTHVMHCIVSSHRDRLESQPIVPQNVTLFGHRVFAKVIKLKQNH